MCPLFKNSPEIARHMPREASWFRIADDVWERSSKDLSRHPNILLYLSPNKRRASSLEQTSRADDIIDTIKS